MKYARCGTYLKSTCLPHPKCQAEDLHLSNPGPKGLENRCPQHKLTGPRRICLLSIRHHPSTGPKIWTYQCQMIVIAPGWPEMSWFWDLLELSTQPPLKLPLWRSLLKQPHNNCLHRNLEYLNLHAWNLDSRGDTAICALIHSGK